MTEYRLQVVNEIESAMPEQTPKDTNAAEPRPGVPGQGQLEGVPVASVVPDSCLTYPSSLVVGLAIAVLVGVWGCCGDALSPFRWVCGTILFLILLGLLLKEVAWRVSRRIDDYR